MGLRRAVAIEQLQPAAWAEPFALVLPVRDAELALHDGAKLHMVDPAIEKARGGGRAEEVGEGDAVVARTGERRSAIAVFPVGASAFGRKERVWGKRGSESVD